MSVCASSTDSSSSPAICFNVAALDDDVLRRIVDATADAGGEGRMVLRRCVQGAVTRDGERADVLPVAVLLQPGSVRAAHQAVLGSFGKHHGDVSGAVVFDFEGDSTITRFFTLFLLNFYNNKNIHSENYFLKAVKIYVEFYSFLCIIKVAEII